MRKHHYFALSLHCILLLLKAFTLQAAESSPLFKLSLEELLNVHIVTATAYKEKPSDTPASAIVISEEVIRDRGYSSLLDLLEDIPQIEIGHNVVTGTIQSLTVLGINGVERFQIMIDGVRVSPLTGNLLVLGHQFSLANAKQVEIILGPMSSLYGADVFSGVINIVTKSGNEGPEGTISTEFGDFHSRNFALIGKLRPEKCEDAQNEPAFSITTNRYFSDGPFMPKYYPQEFSWYNNQFQSGRVLNSPGSTSESNYSFSPYSLEEQADFLHARLNFKRFEFGLIHMTETHSSSIGVLPQYTIYGESTIFRTRYNTVYGKHTHTGPDNRWSLQSQFSHQFYEVSPETNFINNFSSYKPAYKYARDKSWLLEERYSLKIRENRHLTLGLTYQKHDSLPRTADLSHPFDTDASSDNQGFIFPGSDLGTPNSNPIPLKIYKLNYENFGGYAQLHLNPNDRYQLILGARFDDNSLYGSSFNPRVGVVFKPNTRSNIKLLYGTAFLAPPPDKTYAHFGSFVADPANPGGIKSYFMHIPNTDLKPEKIGAFQAEYSYKLRENKKITLNLYDSNISDLHQVVSLGAGTCSGKPVDTLAHWTNQGKARAYGGSIRFDSICCFKDSTFNYFAAYVYSNGDVAGNPLPYSSRHSGRFGLTFKRDRWTVSPRVIYQGKAYLQFKDNSGKFLSNNGFTVANLFAKYRLSKTSSEESSLFLNIENLFDKRYYNPGQGDGSVGFSNTPQSPRYVSGGLRVEF